MFIFICNLYFSYTKPIVKDGIEDMFNNPEVALNKNQPHLTVPRQVIKLKEITQRILSAVNGADSNRIDLEETSGDGSGSGVGSGSGQGSGSGVMPVTVQPTTMQATTDMDNNVETRPTPPRFFETSTMGNMIPDNDDTHDVNDPQNTAHSDDTYLPPKDPPVVQISRGRGGATSLTDSCNVCLLLFAMFLSLSLFLSK